MSDVTVGELFVRLIVSLGVVIGVMAAAAWVLKRVSRGGFSATRAGKPVRIEVLGRQAVGRRSSIAIVRAGARGMVLGVTDNQVTLLVETSADELMIDEAPRTVSLLDDTGTDAHDGDLASPLVVDPARRTIAESLREWTVRRS